MDPDIGTFEVEAVEMRAVTELSALPTGASHLCCKLAAAKFAAMDVLRLLPKKHATSSTSLTRVVTEPSTLPPVALYREPLLHLCRKFFSVKCAAAFLAGAGDVGEVPQAKELNKATECVEVLPENQAGTTEDGQAQLPLKLSLSETDLDLDLSPNDLSIKDLVINMIAKLLVMTKLHVHDADADGNTAFPYVLEVLTLYDPGGGGRSNSELKETPLFCTVENESKDEGSQLLWTWGGDDSEVLNLRSQAFTTCNVDSSPRGEICKYFDSQRGFAGEATKHGTTNLVWPLKKGFLLGLESRITCGQSIYSDNYVKFKLITPDVLATMCGDVEEVENTWTHMSNSLTQAVIDGSHLERVRTVARSGRSMEKKLHAGTSSMFIAGRESEGTPKCFLLKDTNCGTYRYRKLLKVKGIEGIGSGSEAALLILVQKWKEFKLFKYDVSIDLAVCIMCWALLHTGLTDPYSGGLFTVIYLDGNGFVIQYSGTILQLYIQFYHQTLVLQNGDRFGPYSDLEDHALLLFYKPSILQLQTLKKLLRKYGVKQLGHPLTKLRGGFYLHRVLFYSTENCTRFFEENRPVPISVPRIDFVVDLRNFRVRKTREGKLYIARQSLKVLRSLELSEDVVVPHASQIWKRNGL